MPPLSPITILSVASALPLAEGGAVPEWLMLMPAGTSRGVDGRGPYVLSDPARVAAQSMEGGRPLAFDYNHQTVFAAVNGSPSPAAGWIDKLEARDGALWGRVDWTQAGRAAVASREYRFISPAFHHDPKTGEVRTLASVGLVNMPNFAELPAINSQLFNPGDPMDKEALAKLAAALGLPADTALDKIEAQCRDLTAAAQKTPVTTGRAGAQSSDGGVATGAPDPSLYVPMAAFADLQTQVATLVQTNAATRAQAAVDDAMRAGKVTPALKDWAFTYASQDPKGFQTWLGASPVIVAPGALLPGTPPPGADAHAARQDDKTVLAVCANLGITMEQYRATQGVTTAQDAGAKA